MTIPITNDDGFEASTIHALYQTLGKGGAVDLLKPSQPLQCDSRAGFVKAGAPGVGTLPSDDAVCYVDATAVAAALFGIDIAVFGDGTGRPIW